MAINQYTLNHLYQNGILDYVPADLMMGAPMGGVLAPMSNPYMSMAQQGALYQNHGAGTDSFHSSFTPGYTPNDYQSVSNSVNPYVGLNNWNGRNNVKIQMGANAGGLNTFSGNGTGVNNNGYINAVGTDNMNETNNNNIYAIRDFNNAQNSISNGLNKASSIISSTPKLILGLIAGTIGVIGIASLFKRGKKPAKSMSNTSFWSKLNPINWFRKNK